MKTLSIKAINSLSMKYGAHAIERAFDDFKLATSKQQMGFMVLHVIKKVDQGEVIMMREVECHKDEDSRDREYSLKSTR